MALLFDELIYSGSIVVGIELPSTCLVRLGSCLPGDVGDEVRVVRPTDQLPLFNDLRIGQSVWLQYRRGEPVGLKARD
jgi:hypothetical protein